MLYYVLCQFPLPKLYPLVSLTRQFSVHQVIFSCPSLIGFEHENASYCAKIGSGSQNQCTYNPTSIFFNLYHLQCLCSIHFSLIQFTLVHLSPYFIYHPVYLSPYTCLHTTSHLTIQRCSVKFTTCFASVTVTIQKTIPYQSTPSSP